MSETAPLIDPGRPTIGHEILTSALAHTSGSGRVAHAWLITGPQGIGKASMACMAAAWLMAEEQATSSDLLGDPVFEIDPSNPGTNLVVQGSHPDLMLVRPALEDNKSGQIKIDQIRKIAGFMSKKPGRGGWRIVIIDSLDQVNRNGANALLKILEEPPEKAILFLIASKPGRLPPTIRSRCRLVRVPPLDQMACQQIIAEQLPDMAEQHLADLSVLCEGAPGLALDLAESDAVSGYQALCALIAETRLDGAALSVLCDKVGRAGAPGQKLRSGIAVLMARLLRLSALKASNSQLPACCGFEQAAMSLLATRHSAATLGERQSEFIRQAGEAEALYLDYGLFLARSIGEIHQKTLP